MERKILKNKPLVEAIFELRWTLNESKTEKKIDPNYKILIGRIYDKVKEEYPFYEQLPSANIPDEMAEYVVQYRFRKVKDKWPLIQIGPSIVTLNDTENYTWEDFEKRIENIVENIFDLYLDSTDFKVNGLILRYIDAINLDRENSDIFNFLKEKMKTDIKLHNKFFDSTGLIKSPSNFDLRFSFLSTKPAGEIHLRFNFGKKENRTLLIWETMLQSIGTDTPNTKEKIATWVNEAHELIVYGLFFKLIEGDLERKFE